MQANAPVATTANPMTLHGTHPAAFDSNRHSRNVVAGARTSPSLHLNTLVETIYGLPLPFTNTHSINTAVSTTPASHTPDHNPTHSTAQDQNSDVGVGNIIQTPPQQLQAHASTPPVVADSYGECPSNYASWKFFPGKHVVPPPGLSCYDVCQQFPNSLNHAVLDAFLQRNWSAGEIKECLPKNVQDALKGTTAAENPTFLTNRLTKRTTKLIQDGLWDNLVSNGRNGNFLRNDGRPADMPKHKSMREPLPPFASVVQQTRAAGVVTRARNAANRRVTAGEAAMASSAALAQSGSVLATTAGNTELYEEKQMSDVQAGFVQHDEDDLTDGEDEDGSDAELA
ncbi:uncharacterized protein HMPREF1541_01819 [Cyphellophora europaea CBS 101466]|uniref:Uncharacterized protein n=1 Tax=Cyphellophora europaea (strain CBS 101466) TaxID=1220924 RepID=W2S1U9_CYPE1|nr:uncharacterized protein HMPREF1541_01819 [Cyphellophora europaea CBS 101466]ETN42662.1 hypothetical protein HMPREF1541_01819 [Cyphellophora europaea CBS 101466]